MKSASIAVAGLLLAVAVGHPLPATSQTTPAAVASIRKVEILGKGGNAEIEISATQRLVPTAQIVTDPDRLVIDFPNAVPGPGLRKVNVAGSQMTAVRTALYRGNPPVTRVVVDLKSPQPYRLYPSGNSVIVKFGAAPATVAVAAQGLQGMIIGTVEGGAKVAEPEVVPPPKPQPRVQVEFRDGALRISTDKATLAEVLFAVHERTGADIPIPAGAEQEQVVAHLGPGPAREVLAALLNGSKFNFIMVGSETDPSQLRAVLLSLRGGPLPETGSYVAPPATPVARINPAVHPQGTADAPDPDPDDLPPDIYHDDDPQTGDSAPQKPN